MLRLSGDFIQLLHHSGSQLYSSHKEVLPPLPLEPFEFTIMGRLNSLQSLSDWPALLLGIQSLSVKTSMKKLQNSYLDVRQPLIDLDEIATKAENPEWLQEVVAQMERQTRLGRNGRNRYLIMEDLLHANSISRFHFIIRRVEIQFMTRSGPRSHDEAASQETNEISRESFGSSRQISRYTAIWPSQASSSAAAEEMTNEVSIQSNPNAAAAASSHDATPAAAAAASGEAKYQYEIKDLGSMNGVYLNGIRLKPNQWTRLTDGDKVRFAPITRTAKLYFDAFAAAVSQHRTVLGLSRIGDAKVEAVRAADAAAAASSTKPAVPNLPARDFAQFSVTLESFKSPPSSALFPASDPRPPQPKLPAERLQLKDLHVQYEFRADMSDECRARIPLLDEPPRKRRPDGELMPPAASVAPSFVAPMIAAARQPSRPIPPPAVAAVLNPSPASAPPSRSPVAAAQEDITMVDNQNNAPVRTEDPTPAAAANRPKKRTAAEAEIRPQQTDVKRPKAEQPTPPPAASSSSPQPPAATSASIALSAPAARSPVRTGAKARGRRSAYNMFVAANQRTILLEIAEKRRLSGQNITPEPAEQKVAFGLAVKECAARWKSSTATEKSHYQTLADSYNAENGRGGVRRSPTASSPAVVPASGVESKDDGDDDDDVQMIHSFEAPRIEQGDTKEEMEDVIEEDEDQPISKLRPTTKQSPVKANGSMNAKVEVPPAAAASSSALPPAAVASSPPPASSPSSNSADGHPMHSMLEEFTCPICNDLIYLSSVLDCGHSYCRACIDQWFVKKKCCPVCREKHKGAPRSVRSVDNVISMMVAQLFTEDEKRERQVRMTAVDAEIKVTEAKIAEKRKQKQERSAAAARQQEAMIASRRQDAHAAAHEARHLAAAHARLLAGAPGVPPPIFQVRHGEIANILAGRGRPVRAAAPQNLLDPAEYDEDDDDEDYLPGRPEDDEPNMQEFADYMMGQDVDEEEDDDDDVQIMEVYRPPPPQPTYHLNVTDDRRTACRVCCQIIEPGLLRLKQMVPGSREGLAQLLPPPPQHFHFECFVRDPTRPRLRINHLDGYQQLTQETQAIVDALIPR